MLLCSSLSESSIHSTLVSGETLTPASPLTHSESQASIPSPFSQAIFQTCLESFPSLPGKSHYGTSHFKCCMCTCGTIQNQSYVLRESPKSIEWQEKEHTLNCFVTILSALFSQIFSVPVLNTTSSHSILPSDQICGLFSLMLISIWYIT